MIHQESQTKEMLLSKFNESTKRARRVRAPTNLVYVVMAILVVGVLVTLVNIYEMRKIQEIHSGRYTADIAVVEGVSGKGVSGVRQPVVWVSGNKLNSGYLQHVYNVFERLGYVIRRGRSASDWDVLWSHDYPFTKLASRLNNLRAHQKVNHFPGSGFITMKASLAVSQIDFIPTAFKMPSDKNKLLTYIKKHPDKMWVQKSNNHRGIRIKTTKELDLEATDTFVQEYVSKPFLIDGRKFDIGIYTIMTSLNPLRVYIVDGDALFRFCPHDYYPFDPKDVDKYVVGDDYTPMWQMPSLKKFFDERNFRFKESFNAYLRSQGKDVDKLWSDLKSCIRQVYLEKEQLMANSMKSKFRSSRYFFEMVRFDFVLDEELNVYLMEVNMSPNLSSGHFPPNRILYEHVIYNMLGLVGIGRKTTSNLDQSSDNEADMLAADKDIMTFPELCAGDKCEQCNSEVCKLCSHCMGEEERLTLKDAYLEHLNRGSCERVFPEPMSQAEALKWHKSWLNEHMTKLSPRNRLMVMWFIGKCQADVKWCS
ncbi:probable tubulin polyglutamylase ttll-15 [Liolophura sinensis]|uniref:probable tubulin polyglutamylase ttll-15 n=1 Tax=Liolophura sinensis TaxID=3198878 RepID=UPI003158AB45